MQKNKLITITLFLFFVFSSLLPSPALANPDLNAKAAILVDLRSGQILAGENIHERRAPASTTKILTAIIALEKGRLDDIVTVSEKAAKMEGTSIYLEKGEQLTLEELLYAMLLESANDAAVAIAEHLAGSEEEFAEWMNAKARELGARESHFANATGLPHPEHYTTAYDMAIIARYAMKNPLFASIVATKEKEINRQKKDGIRHLYNHNKLLWRYEGTTGIKTGYTTEALQCLVASARRGEQHYLAVVLGSRGTIWNDAMKLLEYGFKNYREVQLLQKGEFVTTVTVRGGQVAQVNAVSGEDVYISLPRKEKKMPEKRINLLSLKAPVKKGQVVGQVEYLYRGKVIATADLMAQNAVALSPARKNARLLLLSSGVAGLFFSVSWLWRRRRKRRKVIFVKKYGSRI
ncbi:MAG: hypothetical protein PWQ91_561 [Eubacteriales bacterium]|nr:hypothetical protein [Eubacteriales bacterium]MDN5363500.1 hypothetical protein [Eubacteriales bacterium]